MRPNNKAQPSGWWVPAIMIAGIALTAGVVFMIINETGAQIPQQEVLLRGSIPVGEAEQLPQLPDLGLLAEFETTVVWRAAEPNLAGSLALVHFLHHEHDCRDSADYLLSALNLYAASGLQIVAVVDNSVTNDSVCDLADAAGPSFAIGRVEDELADRWLVLDRNGHVRFDEVGLHDYDTFSEAIAKTLVDE